MTGEIERVSKFFSDDIVRTKFRDVLGGSAGSYIASVVLAVANSDKLQKCTPRSIYSAALQAATLRLSVDPSTGQAYLVPFKDKATLIVGYKGLYDLAVRTGKYRYINVGKVYEGEVVAEDRLSGFHSLSGGKDSDIIIGWIAAFEMNNGYAKTIYMTVDEIHKHAQKYAKAYDLPTSGWKTDTKAMERKTVLRLLLRRWGYLDPTDVGVLEEVEEASNGDVIDAVVNEAPPEEPAGAEIPSEPRSELEILTEMGIY